jgi:hypothetical protein
VAILGEMDDAEVDLRLVVSGAGSNTVTYGEEYPFEVSRFDLRPQGRSFLREKRSGTISVPLPGTVRFHFARRRFPEIRSETAGIRVISE